MKTIAQQLNIADFPFEIKNKQGKVIYREEISRFWFRREYDSAGREKYFENSYGEIEDNRPKDDVITLNGIKYKRIDE